MRNWLLVAFALFSTLPVYAQVDRITEPIHNQLRVQIDGQLRKIGRMYADEGPVEALFPLDRLTLFLKPSVAQQAALQQLLLDLQDPHSPNYHRWLTPEEYASHFGLSLSDAAKITRWLEAEGFTVSQVARGRSWIAFQGTASAVERAFHANLHRYRADDKVRFANAANPSVPQELADIVDAISGLDDFLPEPDYTAANGTHLLAPDDLATIYDFAPLLQQGIDGTGQKVVVVGASALVSSTTDAAMTDFEAYLSYCHLPTPTLQQIQNPNFPDPGLTGALGEAEGDLETIAGVARNATVIYVYSEDALDALTYAVDQDLAPVITASYHIGCDATQAPALMLLYQGVAQQGNAQGITWVKSSGDSGAAGCDANGVGLASKGLATRYPADIPEVTAVGGTEFNEGTGSYWSQTNDANGASATSYIPEIAWNDSGPLLGAWSSGGGASTFFAKPYWQTGPGVPNDGARDVPDVALAASFWHDGYLHFSNGIVGGGGGTSASAPTFAGMLVLLNHYLLVNGAQSQPGLGNLNPMLYQLAQTSPTAFHDITVGSNVVQCAIGTPNCATGSMGYFAGPGFDLVTGLGSVDVAALAAAALALSTPAPPPALTSGTVANGATYFANGLVPGSWAQVKGSNLSSVARVWTTSDFGGLGNGLPTTLSGTSVTVNGLPAAVYYVSPGQITFQIPFGVSGTVSVQVLRNGVASNVVTGTAATNAPGIFPISLYGINYAAGVFLDGKIVGDPDMGSEYRVAVPGDVVQLSATGLAPSPPGALVGVQSVDAVTVTVGSVTFPADYAGLVAPGEFQVNFTVPQGFASAPEGSYPITISIDGVSSPTAINSTPPGPLLLPIHH